MFDIALTLQVTMWNIALSTLPQCCCYIEIMWVLQHWCTICYNIANGYFCATLRQTCSVSTKLYISATYPTNVADIKVQHCLHFAVAWIVYLGCSFFTPLISIENYQYCSNVVTKVYFVFYIGWRSVQHWNNNITPTLLLQRHHLRIATLLQQCYNIAYGYFCATLQQRCSVSTKLRISNVSCQCCWCKSATLPRRCSSVNCLPGKAFLDH